MKTPNSQFIRSLYIPFIYIIIIWLIKFIEEGSNLSWYEFGVYPRTFSGAKGILFAPLLHGSFKHLISNTVPLFVLFSSIFYFYKNISIKVFIYSYVLVGVGVWIFGRSSYHIGASSLVYAFFGFLVFGGIIRKQKALLAISLVTIFLYGSLIWGIFPQDIKVSYESHFIGFIIGLILAFIFKDEKSSFDQKPIILEDDIKYEKDFWNDIIEK